jgi:hypothetical protein
MGPLQADKQVGQPVGCCHVCMPYAPPHLRVASSRDCGASVSRGAESLSLARAPRSRLLQVKTDDVAIPNPGGMTMAMRRHHGASKALAAQRRQALYILSLMVLGLCGILMYGIAPLDDTPTALAPASRAMRGGQVSPYCPSPLVMQCFCMQHRVIWRYFHGLSTIPPPPRTVDYQKGFPMCYHRDFKGCRVAITCSAVAMISKGARVPSR